MIPLKVCLMAGAAAFMFASGLWVGCRLTAASYQSDIIAEQTAAAEAVAANAKQADQHAAELEKARADREIVYQTITKNVDRLVDRPVYRDVCLDDDGLRLINDALSGQASDPGKPDAAVPGADATGR